MKLQRGTATTPPLWPDVYNRWCIRHMGANLYDHFKNKDLKNMFKRLCIQNQQRKFNALWQMLDQLTAELVKVRALGAGTVWYSDNESCRVFQYGYVFLSCLSSCGNC